MSKARIRTSQDLAAKQDPQEIATVSTVQFENHLASHAGPDHDIALQDGQ